MTLLTAWPLASNQEVVVFSLGTHDNNPNFTDGQELIGFDAASGAIRWRTPLAGILTGLSSPQEVASDPASFGAQQGNGVLYLPTVTVQLEHPISPTSLTITAIRLTDGQRLWQHALVQGGNILLDITLAHDLLFIAYDRAIVGAVITITDTLVTALEESSGAERWENHPSNQRDFITLAVAQDGTPAFVQRSTIVGLQPQDGSMRWQRTLTTRLYSFLSLLSTAGQFAASFQDTTPQGYPRLDHLCVLESANGQTRWCRTFDAQASWVELGP